MATGNTPWTDEELRLSVETYVLLLRFQLVGADARSEPLAQALLGQQLSQRNTAAIRYRMRNISAVVRELGGPTLIDFSPAESVGAIVRPKIREMLLQNTEFSSILTPRISIEQNTVEVARGALRVLRAHVEELEREISWRGHNGPPDYERSDLELDQLRETLEDIKVIDAELDSPSPDPQIVELRSGNLLKLVSKVGEWLGARTTKLADATLAAAGAVLGPIVVVKLVGLLPPLAGAIEAVTKAIAN